jgi:hypothetical protein
VGESESKYSVGTLWVPSRSGAQAEASLEDGGMMAPAPIALAALGAVCFAKWFGRGGVAEVAGWIGGSMVPLGVTELLKWAHPARWARRSPRAQRFVRWTPSAVVLMIGLAVIAVGREPQLTPKAGAAVESPKVSLPPVPAPTPTATAVPSSLIAAVAGPDTAVLGVSFCKNPLLGYTVKIPEGWHQLPNDPKFAPCSAFDVDGENPKNDYLAAGIFITTNEATPEQAAKPAASARVLRDKALANFYGIAVEETPELLADSGYGTTYLFDLGHRTLVVQLQTFFDDPTLHELRRQALVKLLESMRLHDGTCHNSLDRRCGAFFYTTTPQGNQALNAVVTSSPLEPRVGETVTFTVTAIDPDADQVTVTKTDFGDRDAYVLGGEFGRGLKQLTAMGYLRVIAATRTGPTGPWDAPIARGVPFTKTYTHAYTTAGHFTFKADLRSDNSTAAPTHDPYTSVGNVSLGVEVMP